MEFNIRRKIVSMIVALSLIGQMGIPVIYAGAGGHTYDVSQGSITIESGTDPSTLKVTDGKGSQDNIPGDTMLILTGTSETNSITVQGGVKAKLTFRGLSITGAKTVDIIGNSEVELTLEGENNLKCNKEEDIQNGENAGLGVSAGNTLTITAESTGSLRAKGGGNGAGIGGGKGGEGGIVTISGGTVTTTGGENGAGIGGGQGSNGKGGGGTVTISGGTVTATGGGNGAGIGGGAGGKGGVVTISGGTVTATGGKYGAGIGGGNNGGGGAVTISGGTVTATGGAFGAGIGGGALGGGGAVTISGGTVTASGGASGAGIGGGDNGGGGAVTISGGTVTATGGASGAGIGGGEFGQGGGTFAARQNAFVIASSIQNNAYKTAADTQGIIFDGSTSKIYGSPSIAWDAEIPSAHSLTIGEGQSVTVNSGVTLTNKGTLTNNGTLIIGNLAGNNLEGEGEFISQDLITVSLSSDIYTGDFITPTVTIGTSSVLGKEFNSSFEGATPSFEKESTPGVWEVVEKTNIKDIGTYRVVYKKEDSPILSKEFSIKLQGTGSLTMENWIYGAPKDPVLVSATNGIEHVTYQYKTQNAEDAAYINGKPSQAGTYTVKATFAATKVYTEVTVEDNVTITKKPLTIQADNLLVGVGTTIPELTYRVTGLVVGDEFTTSPVITTTADNTDTPGTYEINISGGTLDNADSYTITYENGQLAISIILMIGMRLNETELNLDLEDTSTLLAVFDPIGVTNKKVTWSNDHSDVATFDQDTGLVTAKKMGTAIITATTEDGSFVATCTVNVISFVPKLNEGVYEIENHKQLEWFSNLVNGTLTGESQNKAANAILMNDIVAGGDFVPIGLDSGTQSTERYTGSFDGNGHTVTLSINQPNNRAQGLFGIVGGGATIKNVVVDGSVTGSWYVAGIVGSTSGNGTVTISNCWNKASITGTVESETNAAGILGCNVAPEAQVTINNCYNSGDIKGQTESAAISGWLGDNASVTNCCNVGTVEGHEQGKSFARFGSGTFTNCYQLSTVGTQTDITSKTSAALASGEVAFLLNGSTSDGTPAWGQNLGIGPDPYPVLHASNHRVYKVNDTYANSKIGLITATAKTISGAALTDEVVITADKDQVTLTAPTIIGYHFKGWYKALADGTAYPGTPIDESPVYTFLVTEKTDFAAVYEFSYEYTVKGEEVTITGYNGPGGAITIPAKIENKPVTIIENRAFMKKNLTNVIIPQGVTSMLTAAFIGNPLISVTIPQSVKSIGSEVFWRIEGVLDEFTIYGQVGSAAQTYAYYPSNRHKFHPSLSLGSTDYYLLVGGTEDLMPIILPEMAKEKVTWESADLSVAEVSDTGTVTGKSKGITEITVTTESGGCSAKCIVTVNEKPIPGESVETIILNKETLALEIRGSETAAETDILIARITPDGELVNKAVTWTSDNESVATVSADGKVTAIKEGTAVITVATRDRNYKARCTVTVTRALYYYNGNDTEITITRYNGPGGDIVIPNEIDGRPVTRIGSDSCNNSQLENVTIPEGVTRIGSSAFKDNKLSHVIILRADTRIELQAFKNSMHHNGVSTIYGHPNSTAKTYAESANSGYTFKAFVSVTTKAPGATAKLTWAAVDAEGLKETVTASTIPTHNFIGWYKGADNEAGYEGERLSQEHVYTHESEENRSLVAVYAPLTSEEVSITIDGGTAYTISTAEQTESKTESHTAAYSLGTEITVAVADATDFAYWADEAGKGKILTHDQSYTFAVTGPLTLKAVYNTKIEDKIIVIFKSFYGQIMSRLKLGIEDLSNFMMPKAPTRYGYKFEDWSMTEQQIKDKVTTGPAVIIVTPKYTLLEGAYKISAQNGVLTGGGNDGIYRLNDIVTATASAIELSTGKQFSYWAEANKNPKDLTQPNILSYSDVYKFYATKELDIVAHYVAEGTKVKQKGITQISETKKDSENNKLIFVSMATVPDGCKILKAGIIATNNEEVGTSGNNFNKNAPGVLVRGDAWTGNAYRFTWTKNVSSDEKWYVRSYLLYEDAQKNLFTVYGNMVSQTLRAGQ